MLPFIIRRFLAMLIVLFCVVTGTFFLVRSLPGGPFTRERKLSPAIEENMKRRVNLSGTLWEQYTTYLGLHRNPSGHYSGLLQGDLQISTKFRDRPVSSLIAQTLPVSGTLGLTALLISTLAGVWLGTIAAVRQGTRIDFGAMLGALALVSIPNFVVGPLLVLVFALWLKWLPVGGWGSPQSLVLPAIVLAAPYTAYVARLMRGSMLEVLGQDFLRTAYAKGLSETSAIARHALKVAILPVISFLGPLAANLITGSIVVETIFNIPGIGPFFIGSVLNQDAFLLCGVVMIYCGLLVLMNLFADIAYSVFDPRIRLYES